MSGESQFLHVPVLEKEVLSWLMPALDPVGRVALVDATVGGGGHAIAFLNALPALKVLGIDRDREAIRASRERLGSFGGRIVLAHSAFSALATLVDRLLDEPVKG
ncbi:MAG: 16S rRNA (cytosine(1402)-N(4))-methyltransferase, partial [Acidimicrobiia bacterium]